MKTTHTPGPWYSGLTNITSTTGSTAISFGVAEKEIGVLNPQHSETQDADARLISAAPELLEALETLLDCSPCQNGCDPSDMTCASNLARAAIAKAKGQ